MKTHPSSQIARCAFTRQAFSLLELLMALAVVSCVAAVGYFAVSGTVEVARSGKLESDVAVINSAVRTYLVNGGQIPASADGHEVLARLKTTSDKSTSVRMAGLRGAMLDSRLRGIPAASAGEERAVWNPKKQRFDILTNGGGFSAFDLGGDASAPLLEESRRRIINLANSDR